MPYTDFLPAATPRLANLAACDDWLSEAVPPDSPESCADLERLLGEIEAAPPEHQHYLQILERLRPAVTMAQTVHARRFAGKPLPLDAAENVALTRASALWRAILRAYMRLLGATLTGKHPRLAPSLPLLLHRVLSCCAESMGSFWLARRGFSVEYWQLLHQTFGTAEATGASALLVPDLRSDSSPGTVYAETLLLELAQPYTLSLRDFGWTRTWVRSWARKITISRQAPARGAFAVDLAGQAGLVRGGTVTGSPSLRFLDLSGVGRSVEKLIRALEDGAQPEILGLGSDCPPLAAQALLRSLARAWADSSRAREFPRRASASPVELVSGFGAIHHAIEDAPTVRTEARSGYAYGEADRLQTFRHSSESIPSQQHIEGHETWETIEESDQGFKLRRGAGGMRLAHRQLVALRPAGARQFILCNIDWLTEGPDRTLTIGAHPLQGAARACAVERADRSAPRRSDALMLPVAPGLPAALVLPAGWYERAREIELKLGKAVRRVTLAGLVERGFDYERVKVS
jgi:hypothetical protein